MLESVFCQTTAAPITVVRFGPMLSRFVLDRANEQIVGMEDFADALQVRRARELLLTITNQSSMLT